MATFRQTEDFPHHQVRILVARAAYRIPGAVANRELRRLRESRGVEIPFRAALACGQARIAHPIGPLGAETGERIEVCSLSYRHRYP